MNLDFLDEIDRARDRVKYVTVNDTEFKVKADDTYGFHTIQQVKGTTPSELQGQFTTLEFAKKAIEAYFRSTPKKNATSGSEVTLLDRPKPRKTRVVIEKDSE